MKIEKDFDIKPRGKFRVDPAKIEKIKIKSREASEKIAKHESKFSFPKTILGLSISGVGLFVMIQFPAFPLGSEILIGGLGISGLGALLKINRKSIGKDAANDFEKLFIKIVLKLIKKWKG